MKPIYEKLLGLPDEGVAIKQLRGKHGSCPWHFHTEYELILVVAGRGYRMVGDNLAELLPGDLVLLGANLPHIYQYDAAPAGRDTAPRLILIQFDAQAWAGLLQLPALEPVRRLLRRAGLGLEIYGRARERVAALMRRMLDVRGLSRIEAFLEILDTLSRTRQSRPLASPGFGVALDPYDQVRVDRICQYLHQRLDQPVWLAEAAQLVHMSVGAFSRFFRTHLGKSFPAFVNELRIGRACRLLAESRRPITEIALACGYENLSNFNRQFRRLKGTTPHRFRRSVQGVTAEKYQKSAGNGEQAARRLVQ